MAGYAVRFLRADIFFRTMTQAPWKTQSVVLTTSCSPPALLILADPYQQIISRHRVFSFVITSKRTVEEWLNLFDDSILRQ